MHIVIADRGFVWVGKTEWLDGWCVITDARQVRRWGTTRGLGELAASGPLRDTVLDPFGTVRVPERSVIDLIDCDESKWTAQGSLMSSPAYSSPAATAARLRQVPAG